MTKKNFLALKVGDKIRHNRYGFCIVEDLIPELEGIQIKPMTNKGRELLSYDSGVPLESDFALLEASYRLLKPVTVNKNFTYLIPKSVCETLPKKMQVFKDRVEVGTVIIGERDKHFEGSLCFEVEESVLRECTPRFDFKWELVQLETTKQGFVSCFENGATIIEFQCPSNGLPC